MVFSLIALGIVVLGVLGGFGYAFWKGIPIGKILEDNAELSFKMIAIFAIVGEVIGLALMAINRGVDPFNAFMRYSLLGLVEAVMSMYFMSSYVNSVRDKIKDGFITLSEWLFIFLESLTPFIFATLVSGVIHFMYLESIGVVEIIQYNAGLFTSISYVDFETFNQADFNASTMSHKVAPGRIEMSAIVMVYISVFVNIILVYHYFRYYKKYTYFSQKTYYKKHPEALKKKEVRDAAEKKEAEKAAKNGDDKEKKSEDSKSPKKGKFFSEVKDPSKGITEYASFVESVFEIPAKTFTDFFYNYLGVDPVTKKEDHIVNVTCEDIINGSKTSEEVSQHITKELLTRPGRLKSLYETCLEIDKQLEHITPVMIKIEKLQDQISTVPTVNKDEKIKEKNIVVDAFKAEFKKLTGLMSKFVSFSSTVSNFFKTDLNYGGNIKPSASLFDDAFDPIKNFSDSL